MFHRVKPGMAKFPWKTEKICMGPQLLETNECLIATLESIFHNDPN